MAVTLVAVILLLLSMLRILQLEKRRSSGGILALPFFATALLELFDLLALSALAPAVEWKRCTLFVEALLPAVWLLVSRSYARESSERGASRRTRLIVAASALLAAVPVLLPTKALYYAPDFPAEGMLFLTDAGYCFYLALLTLLVAALVNFEWTLVNASSEALWRVKLDIVALGTMIAVSVFYYSSALLYRSLNMELVPVRSLLFVAASLIIAYSRTQRRGTARVKVSQAVIWKSTVLAGVSGYLILLGLLGEGMKYFGPLFPRVLALSLAFTAGIGLVLVLLSDRAEREIKVFLHKHFHQSKYDYRAQWLDLTERLSTFETWEELSERILCAYCDIFGTAGGALYQFDPSCGWYCAGAIRELEGLREIIADDDPLVRFLRCKRRVFCSRDNDREIPAADRRLIEEHLVSFAVPLFEGDLLTGFILLGDQVVPDEEYRYEDFDLMRTISRQVSAAIQHQRVSEQLTRAKAMEAVGNLATFVVHDLKNLAATVSLVVENARDHIENPEFRRDMLSTLNNTTRKMHDLIARLRNIGEGELLRMRPVNLLALVQRSAQIMPGKAIMVCGVSQTVLADDEELQKVLLNLFLNAVEASEPGAPITAEVGFDTAPFVRVADRGCGMSPRFMKSELFAPFRTSKVSGLGIGLYQCRKIVEAHGGRIEVSSAEGEGSVFTVRFPPTACETGETVIQAA